MKMFFRIMIAAAAAVAMSACSAQEGPKFNAKEYAENKTEHIDEMVDLTDVQEKEVYALYLAQGKQIQKNIKQMKKEGFDQKRPDGPKKAECPKGKPECDKANCTKKAECKKADCDKANCTKKAECKKAECDKANCTKKADCKKAQCDKKADCKKAECDKVNCTKKAECKKAECKKAECTKQHQAAKMNKGGHPRHPRHMVSSEEAKAFRTKLNAILTPEQQAILKAKFNERRERRAKEANATQCSNCAPQQAATK